MAKKRPVRPPADAAVTGQADIKAEWTVENVVATVVLGLEPGEKIDLNQIARKFAECEYNPERFPGLVMRIVDPKATILIFSTGKMVVTGMRAAAEASAVVAIVIKNLKQAKVNVKLEFMQSNALVKQMLDLNVERVPMTMRDQLVQFQDFESEQLKALIEAGIEAGLYRPVDSQHIASILNKITGGIIFGRINKLFERIEDADQESVRAELELALDIFLRGMAISDTTTE